MRLTLALNSTGNDLVRERGVSTTLCLTNLLPRVTMSLLSSNLSDREFHRPWPSAIECVAPSRGRRSQVAQRFVDSVGIHRRCNRHTLRRERRTNDLYSERSFADSKTRLALTPNTILHSAECATTAFLPRLFGTRETDHVPGRRHRISP